MCTAPKPRLRSSARRESGVTSIEYAILGSLIAVVIAASVGLLGDTVGAMWDKVATEVSKAASGKP